MELLASPLVEWLGGTEGNMYIRIFFHLRIRISPTSHKKRPKSPNNHTDVGSWCTSKLTLNVPTNALLGNTQYCPSNTAIANIRSAADRELEGGRFQG